MKRIVLGTWVQSLDVSTPAIRGMPGTANQGMGRQLLGAQYNQANSCM